MGEKAGMMCVRVCAKSAHQPAVHFIGQAGSLGLLSRQTMFLVYDSRMASAKFFTSVIALGSM